MAGRAITVSIDGKYDDKDVNKAIRDLQRLKTDAGVTGPAMGALGKAAIATGAAFAAAFSFAAIKDFFADSIQAAADEQKALLSLQQTLDNFGQASQMPLVEVGIKRLSKMAAVADDDLRPAFQRLFTATGSVTKAQDLLQTALDVSAGTGKDLQTVTLALSKAANGQVSALRRLGVPLDDNTVKTKDFAGAVDQLNAKFGGQAETASRSFAGQMKSISIAVDEAKETIGFALIEAITDATQSIGGTGGIVESIEEWADTSANMISEIAGVVSALTTLNDWLNRTSESFGNLGQDSGSWTDNLVNAIPGLNSATDALGLAGDAIDIINARSVTMADVAPSALNAYVRMGPPLAGTAAALLGIGDAAEDAADGMEKAKTAADFLKQSLSRFTTRDEFITAMRDMGKAAEDAGGKLLGTKAKSIELRGEFANAATSLLTYAQAHGTNAADVLRIWDAGVRKIRKTLIDNKVDPALVDQFINKNLWQTRFVLLADTIGKGRAAEAMRLAGMAAGTNVWKAYVAALDAGRAAAYQSGYALGAATNAGAQAALDIASPSKVFYRNGQMVVEGLTRGITDGREQVSAAAALVASTAATAARTVVQEQIGEYVNIVEQARGAIESMASGIVDQVVGNIDFSTTNADGTPMTPEQMMAAMFGDINQQNAVVAAISSNIGAAMPPQLLQQMLSMDPAAAIALADYLGMHPEMLERLAWNYARLQEYTYNTLGLPMAQTWATIGGESATAMIDNAMAYIADHAKEFRRWVKSNLSTSITVTVDYVTGNMPSWGGQRATGGPVSPGKTYLVGEAGPELITMGSSGGYVTPNSGLGKSVGGNTYSINVQAGVGDPRQIGQQVVEYIKRYESANGRVFAAA